MSETATDSVSSVRKMEDDEVVPNETLVIMPVPSLQAEKVVEKETGGPTGLARDIGPPGGGYGWGVVMSFSLWDFVDDSAICVLNAFTWGINAVCRSRLTELTLDIRSLLVLLYSYECIFPLGDWLMKHFPEATSIQYAIIGG